MTSKFYFLIYSVLLLPAAIRAAATCQDGTSDTGCSLDAETSPLAVDLVPLERRQAASPAVTTLVSATISTPPSAATEDFFTGTIIIDTSMPHAPTTTPTSVPAAATPSSDPNKQWKTTRLLEIILPVAFGVALIIFTVVFVLVMRHKYRPQPKDEEFLDDWPELKGEKAARFSSLSEIEKPLPKAPTTSSLGWSQRPSSSVYSSRHSPEKPPIKWEWAELPCKTFAPQELEGSVVSLGYYENDVGSEDELRKGSASTDADGRKWSA